MLGTGLFQQCSWHVSQCSPEVTWHKALSKNSWKLTSQPETFPSAVHACSSSCFSVRTADAGGDGVSGGVQELPPSVANDAGIAADGSAQQSTSVKQPESITFHI